MAEPIEVVINGKRGKLNKTMSEKVQWTVFRHTTESFGISEEVVDQLTDAKKKEEFQQAMSQLVSTLTLLKDLTGKGTQINEISELVKNVIRNGSFFLQLYLSRFVVCILVIFLVGILSVVTVLEM